MILQFHKYSCVHKLCAVVIPVNSCIVLPAHQVRILKCHQAVYLSFLVTCRLTDQYEEASVHLWELLEGRDKAVAGTTCKYFGGF